MLLGVVATAAALWIANGLVRETGKRNSATSTTFKSYTLTKKEPVSSTASIFHLQPTTGASCAPVQEALQHGIINLEFKQPQIQVVRAYTPLPDNGPRGSLRFLIRHELNGEVSGWLHRLPLGSQIEMRGPNYEVLIPPETERIVFLAGGTGIAPALQAAHVLLQTPRGPSDKKIHILWATRKREDCLGGVSDLQSALSFSARLWRALTFQTITVPATAGTGARAAEMSRGLVVQELEALKAAYPGQVSVSYFVDEEANFIDQDALRRTISNMTSSPPSGSSSSPMQILISGPEGFVAALAGPKVWSQGRQEQGPVQGSLAEVLSEHAHHRISDRQQERPADDFSVYKI